MSYFTEVEFEESPKPRDKAAPDTVTIVNKEKILPIIEKIGQEMGKIKFGTSDLTAYAVDNSTFASPVGNAFKSMKADPQIITIKGFLQLARVELSALAADTFRKWLAEGLEEIPYE